MDHSNRDPWFDSGLLNEGSGWEPKLPRRPTKARPGSEAKVLVMAARLKNRRHIHHPEDYTCFPPLSDAHAIRMADTIEREANQTADEIDELREVVA